MQLSGLELNVKSSTPKAAQHLRHSEQIGIPFVELCQDGAGSGCNHCLRKVALLRIVTFRKSHEAVICKIIK